jgi:isoamyl acetate esterase
MPSMTPSDSWQEYYGKMPLRIVRAKETINFDKLCKVAETLNPAGGKCSIDKNKYAYGGVNVLFELCFNSGKIWIARLQIPSEHRSNCNAIDFVLESEVATMRFLHSKTKIPLPFVHGHSAGFQNPVGCPFILMEAMPGVRLWGGGRKDFIPDRHKSKVYRQLADIIIELYSLKFNAIGMLFPDPQNPDGVTVGPIYDPLHRLHPYGPFTTSSNFYKTRAELLNEYRQLHFPNGLSPITTHVVSPADEPAALLLMTDPMYNHGPFYLAHPDFQISNFLFDNEFNITGLIDWSGCQTLPFESFARHPDKIVPNQGQFLDGWNLPEELRLAWVQRREWFLDIVKECEQRNGSSSAHPIVDMMMSPRSHFAMCVDMEGMLGIPWSLPKEEFDAFCLSISIKENINRGYDL